MTKDNNGFLRWIAVFKLVKAVLMLVIGIGFLRIVHNDSATALDRWIAEIGLDPGRRYVDLAIGKLTSIPPHRLKEIGVGSFVYAAFFFTEGLGLWLRKDWAEWFTAIITGSLVPLEVYELGHHPTIGKGLAVAVNIAIVIYLLVRIRRAHEDKRHGSTDENRAQNSAELSGR